MRRLIVLSALMTMMGSSHGAAQVSVKPPVAGAVAATQPQVQDRILQVRDFGAVGDGITDDTAALKRAFDALTNHSTLEFSPNKTYLISYIWRPNTDADPIKNRGRGNAVGYLPNKAFVTIKGNGATIKCVNHDIAANGGFLFLLAQKSPNLTVQDLRFDMSFTGYKDSAAFYPMCGGIIAGDAFAGSGTQATLCSNFTARNLRFKLYHPNGAFAITAHPYGSDTNNGYKVISVFAAGDASATNYEQQSRGLLMENIRFEKGHNCYGCWGVAYNDATFRDIHADGWSSSSYTIATGTRTGTSFIAPVRFYQYHCTGLTVDNVHVRSLPWGERTGAHVGTCGGVAVESGLKNVSTGGGTITNCEFVLDNSNPGLGPVFDFGIECTLTGKVRIANNTFTAHSRAGVACLSLSGGDNATGATHYVVSGNSSSERISGPFIRLINVSNIAASNRTIKSVVMMGNTVKGWGGEGSFWSYMKGFTYSGSESIIVTGNILDADLSTSPATSIRVDSPTTSDDLVITHNIVRSAATFVQGGKGSAAMADNIVKGAAGHASAVGTQTNPSIAVATFHSAQPVSIPKAAGGSYEYYYVEFSGTGAIVTSLSGMANAGTGVIRTVATGNTGKLTYKKISGGK